MTTSIPPHLYELLAKLEFISVCEKGKKICLNDMTFVDAQSWLGAYKRSRSGEGRKNMIIQLNAVIDDAIASLISYKETEFVPLIVNALCRCKIGLNNLIGTYTGKADTVSRIKTTLVNIDLTLEKYKHMISGHYTASSLLPRPHLTHPVSTPLAQTPRSGEDSCYGTSPIGDANDPR